MSCLILCNPSNPTGCVSSQTSLEDIAAVLRDFPSVIVLSDEIYERLTYEDTPHVSFASLPGMFERTITINGFRCVCVCHIYITGTALLLLLIDIIIIIISSLHTHSHSLSSFLSSFMHGQTASHTA